MVSNSSEHGVKIDPPKYPTTYYYCYSYHLFHALAHVTKKMVLGLAKAVFITVVVIDLLSLIWLRITY